MARVTSVRLQWLSLEMADLGPVNPLPPLAPDGDLHAAQDVVQVPEEMRRTIGYGRVPTIAPYLLQDGYGRDRREGTLRTAVVENDELRATFALDVGGRLWSLVHKGSARELLYRNPVLQPANLALRNAWVAGGVEWNIGTIGHGPTTFAPLHAALVDLPDGTPALRMYEFERLRQLVFQVDAYLPERSEVLMVHVRVLNPNDEEVPVYWWSNIAVPEADDVRVVVPATEAWKFDYTRRIERIPVPVIESLDLTYTTQATAAADYFFEIPDGERPWITALDGDGTGLVQTSTDRLRGRKLFGWGQGTGSQHWQDWLARPGCRYLEIQAGLARTQLEHLPLPAGSAWSWIEAYGLLQVDGGTVHGDDWQAARDVVSEGVGGLVPRSTLDSALADWQVWADLPPRETLHAGSGWGALERRARSAVGDHGLGRPGTPFPDSTLTAEQQPWLDLLEQGQMAAADPMVPPSSYQRHQRWQRLLEQSDGWLALLHLGVVRQLAEDPVGARDAWQRSVTTQPSAWAQRNLAVLDRLDGDPHAASDRYLQAVRLAPECLPLLVETLDTLLAADRPQEVLDLLDHLPPAQRGHGRIQLAEVRAALAVDDVGRTETLLRKGIVVADIREGELSLEQVWLEYQARRGTAPAQPLPRMYDFRMKPPA
jgi:Domain of unknown function (DUF5107)